MITLEQLISLQNAMGVACVISVAPGTYQDEIEVRISVRLPHKDPHLADKYNIVEKFSYARFSSEIEIKFDRFKHMAKKRLDIKLAEYKI